MGIQAMDSRRYILREMINKKCFTLFTWCVLVSCEVIFAIRCDLSNFFYPEFPLIADNKAKHS